MATVKCSKNYVNCRKHPARIGNPADLYKENWKAKKDSVTAVLKEAKETVDNLPENATVSRKNATKSLLKNIEIENFALLPQATFDRAIQNPELTFMNGRKVTYTEKRYIKNKREAFVKEIKHDLEREQYYRQVQDKEMNVFQTAVAGLLVSKGDFYNKDVNSWGDTRGTSDYSAKEHFEKCGVKGVNNYNEHSSWSTYDSFSSDEEVGIEAQLSCNCGEKYKSTVFYSAHSNSIINELMNQ